MEDIGFAERQNDYIRSIGIDPENMTPDDYERFYNAVDAGVFDPHKPNYWVHRWQYNGATDPATIGTRFMSDYYSTSTQRGAKSGLTLEQTAMAQALLQYALKNPKTNLKHPTTADPSDLAIIQNIHPDDFNKGEALPQHLQDLFKKTGYLTSFDYVAPDGKVYRRTTNVRANDNPLGGIVSSILRDLTFDPILEFEDFAGPTLD